MHRAVFLDRDGVINENRPDHVKSVEELVLLPGAAQALCLLGGTGMPVVVVSNQGAINRGLVSREEVEKVNRRMIKQVHSAGGRIDAVFYCPHRADEECACRKPRPGLLEQAAVQLDIDLSSSYVVGDALSDVEAALAVKAQPLLVLTGRGARQASLLAANGLEHVPIVKNLLAAAIWILRREGTRVSSTVATMNPLSGA